ncbi:hypothetical protein P3W55_14800 [Pseudomonas citronellolis]|uniref:Uncharacterized protein n=1 Tax=Pseudomonas citronellolis TaxID=53408 RepID=A0AAW6P661_9PSED|nr:hypothetical protein [Pseudomonas citronellolis]MDF3842978.1 hypothetical protein [Pseudomonas citronellolis]
MACCIAFAMLLSEMILLWERARRHLILNTLAIVLAVLAMALLAWHWQHIEELIRHPFAFTFFSNLLDEAGGYCRGKGIL